MPIPPMKPSARLLDEISLGISIQFDEKRQQHEDTIDEHNLTLSIEEQLRHSGFLDYIDAANDRAERMLAVLREPLHNDIRRLTFATCPDTQSLRTCLCVNGVSSRCWDRGQAAIAVLHDILAEVAAQEPGQ